MSSNASTPQRVHSARDVQEAVRNAPSILPVGSGTKPTLSRAPAGVLSLDMRGLHGIVEYQPAEYTITALAGTPISEVESALNSNGQYLPFDPPFRKAGATVGGTVGAGLSGSGRLRYGGIRDFILGTRFVDGQGSLIRGGGKVVKNAAGFDFPKLLVGSMGRLGILVDATFKVFPRPPAYATLITEYGDLAPTLDDMRTLTVSPVEVLAVDLLAPSEDRSWSLITRIGGAQQLLDARVDRLKQVLGKSEILTGEAESEYWSDVAEFNWVAPELSIVKIPLTLSHIPKLEGMLAEYGTPRRYAVAGNVLWAAWQDTIGSLHSILAAQGLTGVVLRGASDQPLIGSQPASAFAARIKAALDPAGKFTMIHPI